MSFFNAKQAKIALIQKGITSRELAKEMGISYSTLVRKMYKRPETFTMGEMAAIAEILDVNVNDLFLRGDGCKQ